jgi:hypothetical protein
MPEKYIFLARGSFGLFWPMSLEQVGFIGVFNVSRQRLHYQDG